MNEATTPEPARSGWRERRKKGPPRGPGEAVYGLGLLGALVYYIQAATSFGAGLLGVVKAILWPAFFVYSILQFVGA